MKQRRRLAAVLRKERDADRRADLDERVAKLDRKRDDFGD